MGTQPFPEGAAPSARLCRHDAHVAGMSRHCNSPTWHSSGPIMDPPAWSCGRSTAPTSPQPKAARSRGLPRALHSRLHELLLLRQTSIDLLPEVPHYLQAFCKDPVALDWPCDVGWGRRRGRDDARATAGAGDVLLIAGRPRHHESVLGVLHSLRQKPGRRWWQRRTQWQTAPRPSNLHAMRHPCPAASRPQVPVSRRARTHS